MAGKEEVSSLQFAQWAAEQHGAFREVQRIALPSAEEFHTQIRPLGRPFIFDCSEAFAKRGLVHAQTAGEHTKGALDVDAMIAALRTHFGKLEVKVRTRYQDPNRKRQQVQTSFDFYLTSAHAYSERKRREKLTQSTENSSGEGHNGKDQGQKGNEQGENGKGQGQKGNEEKSGLATGKTRGKEKEKKEKTKETKGGGEEKGGEANKEGEQGTQIQEEKRKRRRKKNKFEDTPYLGHLRTPKALYLQSELPWPPFCDPTRLVSPVLWCGVEGTGTPLHVDTRDNFALQLLGEKRWFLVPPYHSARAHYEGFRERYTRTGQDGPEEQKGNANDQQQQNDNRTAQPPATHDPGSEAMGTECARWVAKQGVKKTMPAWSQLPDIRHLTSSATIHVPAVLAGSPADKTATDEAQATAVKEAAEGDPADTVALDVVVVTLRPMEMLYLPVYTGHAVQNLGFSCMVNFWDRAVPGLLQGEEGAAGSTHSQHSDAEEEEED
eukprot:g38070.t1